MKAIVVHQYGGPEVLKFEEYPDPVAGPGEVLVRVAASSVNPIDYKRRAGLTKDFYPLKFPSLIGVDIAGTVIKLGPGVDDFSGTDRSRPGGDRGEDWAGSGGIFRGRPSVRHGGRYLRRALRGESCESGESSPGARFDPGGGAAAGDSHRQPTALSHGNQSGPEGSRRRRCWERRAFGGIHCEGTRGDCDRGGFEEADG